MIAKIIDNKRIEVYDLSQFDVDAIIHSGQVFRYFETERGFMMVVGDRYAEIYRDKDIVSIDCSDAEYFFRYFDLATDYNQIKNNLKSLSKLIPAIDLGGGIRILNSDFEEIVISFIISANNNIKRFTKTLNALAENYGKKLDNGCYAFPTVGELSRVTEAQFKALGCGYRAPYLVKATNQLAKIDLSSLVALPDNQLIKQLTSICGVGNKVASCVALFCGDFHRLGVVPIDTWIAKALECFTNEQKESLLANQYAGVAQQYMFYYMQHMRKEL